MTSDTFRALRSTAFFFLLGCAFLPAQGRVLVVDASNGPGTGFTDLPEAVAAALEGDILMVRAGRYGHFSTNKGISVLCEPGTRIEDLWNFEDPAVTVTGLAAGRQFVLRGADLGTAEFATVRVRIENCSGRVILEDVRGLEASQRSPACDIATSSDVRLHRCVFSGRHGVRAVDSTVTITGSHFVGLHHPLSPLGSEALSLERCTAVVSRCELQGGEATFFGARLPPAAGVLSVDSDLTITGDGSTSIAAGGERGLPDSTPVPAIAGSGGSLRIHSAIPLRSNAGAPPIASGLTATLVDTPSVFASGADLGGTVEVELFGRPGAAFLALAGLPAPPVSLPGVGLLAIDLQGPIVVTAAGIVPPSRRLAGSIAVPVLDSLYGLSFTWQAADIALGGGLLLSNPVTYTHGR